MLEIFVIVSSVKANGILNIWVVPSFNVMFAFSHAARPDAFAIISLNDHSNVPSPFVSFDLNLIKSPSEFLSFNSVIAFI